MGKIARDFLLPDPTNNDKPRYHTRSDIYEYFKAFVDSQEGRPKPGTSGKPTTEAPGTKNPAGVANKPPAHGGTDTSGSGHGGGGGSQPMGGAQEDAKPTTRKPSVFFENLRCGVQDDNLLKLTDEINRINHIRSPIAASLLLRALFECALVFQLKLAKKWTGLVKDNKGRDPQLSAMIAFSAKIENEVFPEHKISRILQTHTTQQAKDYLDSMTHLKYQDVDAITLATVGNNIRGVIQYILTETENA